MEHLKAAQNLVQNGAEETPKQTPVRELEALKKEEEAIKKQANPQIKSTTTEGPGAPQNPERPQISPSDVAYYKMEADHIGVLIDTIQSVVGNKYAQQAIFNCFNDVIIPVKK